MIFTRYGEKVEIVGGNCEKGIAWIKYQDGQKSVYVIGDLKADGGMNEIHEAIIQKGNKQ